MKRGKKLSFKERYILTGLKLVWQIIPLIRLTYFVFLFSFSVFTAVKSFVSLHQAASLLPSGHIQAPHRIIPGMVTLLTQDPIRVLLYRHVIITIQDETTMTGIRLRATTQEVTKATDPLRGRIRCPLIGDRGRISPSSRRVITTTSHVTRGNIRTIGTMAPRAG